MERIVGPEGVGTTAAVPATSPSARGEDPPSVCPSRLSLGRSRAPEKSRRKGSIGSSALALASCRFAAGRLRGRGAHGCGGYGFGEGCMGWDLDAVAMVGDQERRPLEQRVGR